MPLETFARACNCLPCFFFSECVLCPRASDCVALLQPCHSGPPWQSHTHCLHGGVLAYGDTLRVDQPCLLNLLHCTAVCLDGAFQFSVQLAHGSPTRTVGGFSNVKVLYEAIAKAFDIASTDVSCGRGLHVYASLGWATAFACCGWPNYSRWLVCVCVMSNGTSLRCYPTSVGPAGCCRW